MEATSIRPIAILTSYLSLAALLTGLNLRTIYQANKRARAQPAPSTLRPPRNTHLFIFGTLALISLGTTWYYMLSFFAFSYRDWAHENDLPLPIGLWGTRGLLAGGRDAVGLHLGPWLRDTKLFREAWEAVLDGSIRFWWSQQIFIVTTAWSVFLGIEGARTSKGWSIRILTSSQDTVGVYRACGRSCFWARSLQYHLR